MSSVLTVKDLQNKIPVLNDAHKKTPVGPRLETLEILMNLTKFTIIEPYFVENILQII